MRKGDWRHVWDNVTKIREHMQEECDRRRKVRPGADSGVSKTESQLPPEPGSRQRRFGPVRVFEICTWTCMMSIAAASRGWEA